METMIRTSKTHPLQIAEVRVDSADGRIGVTLAPGKCDPNSMSGGWARELASDLDAIEAWGTGTIVTLIEPHEFELLEIPTLGEAVRERGIDWLHLPIRDVSIPDAKFEADWPRHSARLRARLKAGENVLIHCRGGLGRAGMIAARLLVDGGLAPAAAITRVRAARPGAIETPEQEAWVLKGLQNGIIVSHPAGTIPEGNVNRTRSAKS
jgi:protein-tyrosine phosphatase